MLLPVLVSPTAPFVKLLLVPVSTIEPPVAVIAVVPFTATEVLAAWVTLPVAVSVRFPEGTLTAPSWRARLLASATSPVPLVPRLTAPVNELPWVRVIAPLEDENAAVPVTATAAV